MTSTILKTMFLLPAVLILLTAGRCTFFRENPGNKGSGMNVLVVTGGHGFHEDEFYAMIFSLGAFSIDILPHPRANQALLSDSIGKYDVIVFYDMWQEISEREKEAFLDLTRKGTGLVFLHHSLVSYQEWDTFTEIRGGRYNERGYGYPQELLSGYKYDLEMRVSVADRRHPVTKGINDFDLTDEGYSNITVLPDVTVLLTTDHPDCSPVIGWAHHYDNSRVVYILPGHDNNSWSDSSYKKIVANAVLWAGNNNRQ